MSTNTRILILEDDQDLCKLIEFALASGQREIRVAHSVEDTFKLVDTFKPDILILDIALAGSIDGITFCETLFKDPRYRKLQVIIASGSDLPEDAERARQLGVYAYMKKPFSIEKLAFLVRKLESKDSKMMHFPPITESGGKLTLDTILDI